MPSDNKPGWRQITFISWQALPAGAQRCCAPGHCNILRQSVTCRSGFARDFQPRLPRAERPCQGCRPRRCQIGGPAGPVRWRRLATRWRPGRPAACPPHGQRCGPVNVGARTHQRSVAVGPRPSLVLLRAQAMPDGEDKAGGGAEPPKPTSLPPRPNRGRASMLPAEQAEDAQFERRRTQVSVPHTLRRYQRLEDTSRATCVPHV